MKKPSTRSAPSSPGQAAKKPKGSSRLPEPGEVLNYSYLWEREYRDGRDEGIKDRPVAVVLMTVSRDGLSLVHVVPFTTKKPGAGDVAIEVPQAVRRQLRLSGDRSWIVVSEWNRYAWPGYDTRPIPGREPSTSYGFIPSSLLQRVLDAMVAVGIGRPVDRDQ
ncbi:hypothetical protein [Sphingomonas lacusdianchii]|jgi:hypothetical protein|uniref:hypothetical protein n=1 Tax=Sphingomonas lacusdianchii TaxID=2917992 RepID=UPI001F58C5F0|nr:hypothetical protein [Sphingomonas sp. JXJ CY 53]